MQCPLCSRDAGTASYLSVNDYEYIACVACGAVRLQPFPQPDDAAQLYGDEYFTAAAHGGYADYAADAAIHRRNGRARLRKLGAAPHSGAMLVDVGCAYGFTLVEAAAAGWVPLGVDVNAAACAEVQRSGFRAAPSLSALELAPGSVSAITFFQVLEHLPDPVATLRDAAGLLEPGGRVLIETWDRRSLIARAMKAKWQQATPPSVLWLLDEDDVEQMCSAVGLQLQRWRHGMKWVSVGLVAGQLGNRRSRLGGSVGMRLQKLALPYALGDLVTAHATKL